MRYANEAALSTAVRKGELPRAVLLCGSENYLIESWARKLCGSTDDPFNLQRLDGRKLDLDALYDAVEALPLMAARKTVLVDDLDLKALGQAEMKQLEELLGDLPESCLLIVTAKAPDFDARSAGGKKLIKLIDAAGAVAELGARAGSDMVRYLSGIASKQGCSVSNETVKYMLGLCDNDMLALRGEMEKACAYVGEGEVTRDAVDAVCIPRTEARVFDLQKCILTADASRALHLLDALFYLREPAVSVLATLSMSFCDLYRARAARDAGMALPQLAQALGYKGPREYRIRKAYGEVGRLSADALRRALDLLLRCDVQMKSSPVSERVLLEQTVLQLIMTLGEAA